MLKYEWKKLLFYRKGILLILLFLIAELMSLIFFTAPYDRELENNRLVYETYLEQVKGLLTQEKREYLEEEMSRLNQVHRDMEELKQGFYSGEISDAEYETRFPVLLQEDEKYIGFSKLYIQYIFVREAENRSFLYTGGWEKLLTKQSPDYLFFLLLLALLTPVFCGEYGCHMHEILLTQKKSAKQQVRVKLCVALTLTAALAAICQLMQLGYCALRFGLPDGGCSLQSLYSFGNSPRSFTLWQAFWFRFAVTEMGYLYGSLLILTLSVFMKKVSLTVMSGIALLPLPFLAAGGGDAFRLIPAPWALTTASVYLKGGKNAMPDSTMLSVFGISLFVMVVMVLMIVRYNKNFHCRRHFSGAVLGICLLVLLSGCGKKEYPVYYNSRLALTYETEEYRISGDRWEYNIEKKSTGEVAGFPMTGTEGKTVTCCGNLFGRGDKVYYFQETSIHPDAGSDSIRTTMDLVELDLCDMKQRVLYHWDDPYEKWFFGLLEKPETEDSYYGMEMLFVHEGSLYYRESTDIFKMSLLTGSVTEVLTCNRIDLSYDGSNIYYLDDYNRLTICNLASEKTISRNDINANQFFLTEEGIYFTNRADGNRLYLWNQSTDTVSVADSVPQWIQDNVY